MNEHERQLYQVKPDNHVIPFRLSNDTGPGEASVLNAARFFETDPSRRYLYTANRYLVRIDLDSRKCIVDTSFSPYPNVRSLNPIELLRDGRLVAGHTLATLQIYDPSTGNAENLFSDPQSVPIIENVRFLLESREPGIIWVGTHENGLFKIQLSGKIVSQLSSGTNPGLVKDAVLVVYEAQDTSVWIGTFGGGLTHYMQKEETVVHYHIEDGLSDQNVVGILPEGDSVLWISTYNGLNRFDIRRESFQTFTIEDGLTHNEFNYASFFKDRSGRFYFGGMDGFVRFAPGLRLQETPYPAPRFTLLTRYDQRKNETRDTDLVQSRANQLTISPYDTYFQVHWTVTSYFQKEDIRYFVKLDGLEDQWTFLGNRNSIRFYSLKPGKYSLRVKAVDSKGNEALEEAVLPLRVRPVFYRTWWFLVLAALLMSGVIYGIFQYPLNQLLKIENLRTKISSDLHDDLGSMLSGLAMQSELLEMNAPEDEKPRLRKIAMTSRKAVHRMRDLVWSIDARKDRLSDLFEKMQETAEDLLLPAGFEYAFHIHGFSSERRKLTINTRQNLFLLFKEALNNIVKHSNGDHVDIRLVMDMGRLGMYIRDNGTREDALVSGKPDRIGTGQGLQNMQMRAEHLHGRFQVNRENGFEIRVEVPANHIFM
jgi:two-component sensor histidine kinase